MEYTIFTNQNARVKEEFSVDKITNLGGTSVVIDYIKDGKVAHLGLTSGRSSSGNSDIP